MASYRVSFELQISLKFIPNSQITGHYGWSSCPPAPTTVLKMERCCPSFLFLADIAALEMIAFLAQYGRGSLHQTLNGWTSQHLVCLILHLRGATIDMPIDLGWSCLRNMWSEHFQQVHASDFLFCWALELQTRNESSRAARSSNFVEEETLRRLRRFRHLDLELLGSAEIFRLYFLTVIVFVWEDLGKVSPRQEAAA